MAEAWRVSPLPDDWQQLRRLVFERDGYRCVMRMRDGSRCRDRATDCDHVNGDADHSLDNLQSLCAWHHRRKTAKQANAARNVQGRMTERRPRAKHPGEL